MDKKKINISNTMRLVVILIILVLLMAGAYYYFFSQLRSTGESISSLENETGSLTTEEANLDSLREVFSQTSSDRDKINSYFVQSDGAIDFITTIENLAAFAHLGHQTDSINTQDSSPTSPSHELLRLGFRTTGSWQNTFYFISLLESLPFNLTVEEISMHATTGGDTSEWQATYDFSIVKLK